MTVDIGRDNLISTTSSLIEKIGVLPGDCFRLAYAYYLRSLVATGAFPAGEAEALLSDMLQSTSDNNPNAGVLRSIRTSVIDDSTARLPVLDRDKTGVAGRCVDCSDCEVEVCPRSGASRRQTDAEVLTRVA